MTRIDPDTILEPYKERPSLLRLVVLQLLATALLSLAIGWFQDWAWSALAATMIGGVIASITGFYFSWRSFLHAADDSSPQRLLADVYHAALVRALLVGLALAVAFKYGSQLDKPLLLLGFIVVSLVGVVATTYLSEYKTANPN